MSIVSKLTNVWHDNEKRNHYILYIIFGVATTIVDWGIYILIRILKPTLNENIANVIGIISSIVFAYCTNKKYVFKSKDKKILKEFLKFCGSRGFTLLFNVIAFWILVSILRFNEYFSKAIIAVVVVILNYITSNLFVFRKGKVDDKK